MSLFLTIPIVISPIRKPSFSNKDVIIWQQLLNSVYDKVIHLHFGSHTWNTYVKDQLMIIGFKSEEVCQKILLLLKLLFYQHVFPVFLPKLQLCYKTTRTVRRLDNTDDLVFHL